VIATIGEAGKWFSLSAADKSVPRVSRKIPAIRHPERLGGGRNSFEIGGMPVSS